jgi:hypothetical protein
MLGPPFIGFLKKLFSLGIIGPTGLTSGPNLGGIIVGEGIVLKAEF